MKRSRFTETQIVSILKEADAGAKVKDVCRRNGISDATFYNWKPKRGGMSAAELKRLKEAEVKLAQYKGMYADLAHGNYALKDMIEKKLSGHPSEARARAGTGPSLSHHPLQIS